MAQHITQLLKGKKYGDEQSEPREAGYADARKDRTQRNGCAQRVPKTVWLKLALVLIVVIVVVKLVVGVKKGLTNNNTTMPVITKNEKIDITPTLIRSIEQIGEWSFLEIDDEEMVDTLRRGVFSKSELVRIYYGTLRIGFNLKETREGWLAMSGDTLVAKLPPMKLLDDNFIDEARTRSFIASGKWTHADRQAMYYRAAEKMRRRCLTEKNYRTARENAKEQFEQLLHSLGFEKIRVGF